MFTQKILETLRRTRVFALGGLIVLLMLPGLLSAQNGGGGNPNAVDVPNCQVFSYERLTYKVVEGDVPYTVFKWKVTQTLESKNAVSHIGFFVCGGAPNAKTKSWMDANYANIKAAFSLNSGITEADANSAVSWGTDPSCRKTDWVIKVSNPSISTAGKTFYVVLKIPGRFQSQNDAFVNVKYANNCCQQKVQGIGCLDECNMTASATGSTICYGQSNGTVTLTSTGGEGNLSYSWTGPNSYTANTQSISGLGAGSYFVTVMDTRGCKATSSASVIENSQINITATPNFTCYGASSGSISLNVSGGAGGYSYAWSGPSSYTSATKNPSGLAAGAYTVTVSDSRGCSNTASATVTTNPQITITATGSFVCYGATNGTITLAASCDAGETYSWTGPNSYASTSKSLTGLAAGNYLVTVSDTRGCQATASAMVTGNSQITVGTTVGNVCYGATNGSINLSASGGSGGYSYAWAALGGSTSTSCNLTGLTANTYTVTVTDSRGCSATASATVTTNPQLFVTATPSFTCYGASGGQVTLDVMGGTSGYTYSWSGPSSYSSTDMSITGLAAGTYQVLVTDSKNCSISASATVTSNPQINVSSTVNNVSCDATNDGSIALNVAGGCGAYTFMWSGPESFTSTQEDISDLVVGDYMVTVTDTRGCFTTKDFEVDQEECPKVVCTYTQGYFGNEGGKSSFPDGSDCKTQQSTRDALDYALDKWTGGLPIGGITLTHDHISDILAYLPGGGPYQTYGGPLLSSAPKTTLIAQILTLGLNIGLNGGPNGHFAKWVIPSTFWVKNTGSCDGVAYGDATPYSISGLPAGTTVKDIFDRGSAAVSNYNSANASLYASAAGMLNEIFDECGLLMEENGAVAKGSGMNAGALGNTFAQNLKDLSVAAYPNPFTDQVTIKFASPVSGNAVIEFFDLSGRKIQSINKSNVIAGQFNTVEYVVPSINSKAVIYKVTIGNYTVNGKLIGQK